MLAILFGQTAEDDDEAGVVWGHGVAGQRFPGHRFYMQQNEISEENLEALKDVDKDGVPTELPLFVDERPTADHIPNQALRITNITLSRWLMASGDHADDLPWGQSCFEAWSQYHTLPDDVTALLLDITSTDHDQSAPANVRLEDVARYMLRSGVARATQIFQDGADAIGDSDDIDDPEDVAVRKITHQLSFEMQKLKRINECDE